MWEVEWAEKDPGSKYSPALSGKGLCPGPIPMGNVLLADGELYTGTVSSFQGSDPTISRSQSLRPIKTETSLNWLQGEILPLPIEWAVPRPQGGGPVPPAGPESRVSPVWDLWADGAPHRPPTDPAFMASAYIPESLGSSEGDDDKIYFFFREIGQELEFFENTMVSRIARICKVRGLGHPRSPTSVAFSCPPEGTAWLLAFLFFSELHQFLAELHLHCFPGSSLVVLSGSFFSS